MGYWGAQSLGTSPLVIATRRRYLLESAMTLSHNPLNALVAPRTIRWISSRDAQGRVNLAPYSFFNAFNSGA